MDTTSASLLERLRTAGPGAADWRRLHDLYLPLVRAWVAQAGLTADADDLAQDVLVVLVRELPGLRWQRDRSFRLNSTVGAFTVRAVRGAADQFAQSLVIAANFNNVSLASVDRTVTGAKFEFVYDQRLAAPTVRAPAFRFDTQGADIQNLNGTDFRVKKA